MAVRMFSLLQKLLYFSSWLCLIPQIREVATATAHGQLHKTRHVETPRDAEGLNLLVNPPEPCVEYVTLRKWWDETGLADWVISIVAVHGLDGHWKRSWTAANGVFWLEDILPLEITCARVYSFSHDSRTRGSDTPLTLDISDHGKALVAELSMERKLTETERVPILFIGHSLGGIIIKSALLESELARVGHLERCRSIKISTYAVLFLGTPHQGGEGVSLAEIIRKVSSTVSHTNKKLLDKMVRNSEWLLEFQSRYNAISQDFETTCFYETLKMPLPVGKLLIVPKDSAIVFGAANSEAIPLNADHSTIAKFGTSSDQGFQRIVKRLRLFVKDARPKIERNWLHWEANREYNGIPIRTSKLKSEEKEFNLGIAFNSIRNPHFTGREKILQTINEVSNLACDDRSLKLVVLHGAGGMGKTQIAVEYAHRLKANYTSIFWIDGSRNHTASASILEAVERLKRHYRINGLHDKPWFDYIRETLTRESDFLKTRSTRNGRENFLDLLSKAREHVLREMFLEWLSSDENCGWLMIINNVDDLESFDFRNWLPSTLCGSVVITTRRKDLAKYWHSIEIDTMTEEESMILLRDSSSIILTPDTQEWNSSFQLIKELGYLPLAISQAGAHISMSQEYSPVSQYLTLYQKFPKEYLASKATEVPWDSSRETVLATWEIPYATLRRRSPLASRILLLCGFLAETRLLSSYSRAKTQQKSTSPSSPAYSMHPLIHFWTTERLDMDDKKSKAHEAGMILRNYCQSVDSDGYIVPLHTPKSLGSDHVAQLLSIYQDLYPCREHPHDVIGVEKRLQDPSLRELSHQFSILSSTEGLMLRLRGRVDEFWRYMRHIYLGHKDVESNDWALIYSLHRASGNRGFDLIDWVLCRALKEYPPKHPRTLEMIGDYAFSYRLLSNNRMAFRSWYWWLLLARSQVLGPSHPLTAGAYIGLGLQVEKCKAALELVGKAYDIRIESLGYDDFLTQYALQAYSFVLSVCRGLECYGNDVVTRLTRVAREVGDTKAAKLFGRYTFAFYLMRAVLLKEAPLPMPATWRQLLSTLEVFFDWMLSDLTQEEMMKLAPKLLDATKHLAKPDMSSHDEEDAYEYSRPGIVGLHILISPPTVTQTDRNIYDMILYPTTSYEARLLVYRQAVAEYPDWPVDGWTWRLLQPLSCSSINKASDWNWSNDFLLSANPEQDPLSQQLIFKWFEYLGHVLIETKLSFDQHSRDWRLQQCIYTGGWIDLRRSDFDPTAYSCGFTGYICKEKLNYKRFVAVLTLTGKIGIDRRFNFRDLRMLHYKSGPSKPACFERPFDFARFIQ